MSWEDFLIHFRGVDVCYTKRDLSNLHLDAKEEFGCLGPFLGCIVGTLCLFLCALCCMRGNDVNFTIYCELCHFIIIVSVIQVA